MRIPPCPTCDRALTVIEESKHEYVAHCRECGTLLNRCVGAAYGPDVTVPHLVIRLRVFERNAKAKNPSFLTEALWWALGIGDSIRRAVRRSS